MEKHVSMLVNSVRSRQAATVRILIRPNVKNAENVLMPVPYNAIAHLQRPCKFSCPVDAISYDEYGISVIDEEKCIRCGKCIHSCPFGAIGSKTWIVDVINAINSGKHVYAMLAPATEGQFGPGHYHGKLEKSHERAWLYRVC